MSSTNERESMLARPVTMSSSIQTRIRANGPVTSDTYSITFAGPELNMLYRLLYHFKFRVTEDEQHVCGTDLCYFCFADRTEYVLFVSLLEKIERQLFKQLRKTAEVRP